MGKGTSLEVTLATNSMSRGHTWIITAGDCMALADWRTLTSAELSGVSVNNRNGLRLRPGRPKAEARNQYQATIDTHLTE